MNAYRKKIETFALVTGLSALVAFLSQHNNLSQHNTSTSSTSFRPHSAKGETKTELSDFLYENAKVTSMYHKDARRSPVFFYRVVVMIPHPAENKITFDGQIDFEINNLEIYSRFKLGDSAVVSYRTSYKVTYEDLDGNGINEPTKKEFIDYHFIDAQPKK